MKKGTITFFTRTIFKDSKEYDKRQGHPGMLPIASNEITGEAYYLLLTSQVGKYNIYPDKYYNLEEHWQEVHLIKPSLIDITYVYKGEHDNKVLGGLTPRLYKEIIRKMKKYQDNNPCKYYLEIKDKL